MAIGAAQGLLSYSRIIFIEADWLAFFEYGNGEQVYSTCSRRLPFGNGRFCMIIVHHSVEL